MSGDKFDFTKEYGIVLEGGGAKGAYQIGVWKALMEYGVKIRAVAGVSVGALNGALMCMGDYDMAVDIWKNITYSRIMNVNDEDMDKLMSRQLSKLNLHTVSRQSKKFLVSGGIDVTPLRQLMDEYVDEKKIRESDIEFIMGTFNVSNLKELDITAKEAEDGYLKDYLMASASFPLFKHEKLHGQTFLDGGLTNNVPIDMLINRGYKNIIVIRVYGIGLEKKVKIPEDVKVTYIAPKIHLCNVLEFNRKKAVRNIMLGYYDAVRILKPLAGIDYYIDADRTEKEYLDTLLSLPEDSMRKLFNKDKPDSLLAGSFLRKALEEDFPQLSSMLKLQKNWNYSELYYAILEYVAKKLRVPKYKIYTEKEFLERIHLQQGNLNLEEKSDPMMELAMAMIQNILA